MGMMDTIPRILVVDDDVVLLHALSQTLFRRLKPLVVESVISGSAALARLHDGCYDLVLSDIKMPNMDGLTLLREVKGIDWNIPVILMTGHTDSALVLEAVNLGAADVLSKPLDRERLVVILQRLLTGSVIASVPGSTIGLRNVVLL
jgi:DNA-binding NtrC family response regulator